MRRSGCPRFRRHLNLTGAPGISGYVQYDSSYFHGFAVEIVPNSAIVGLDIDVFGAHFDLGDLVNIPGLLGGDRWD